MEVRKRKRRGLKTTVFLLFVVVLSGYSGLAVRKSPPVLATSQILTSTIEPAEIKDLAWPARGQGAFGTLQDGLLASSGNEKQKPIASITKVVTALAVLEKTGLSGNDSGPSYTISQRDIQYYHNYVSQLGSVLPVNEGQQITLRDALYGMMLPSANNIADGLADWVFGSQAEYLKYANDMLKRYGLDSTVVADASGFNPGSKSTPSDLVRLGQLAMRHPLLSQIVSTQNYNIPVSGEIKNTNFLVSQGEAVGIKTGNTDEAGSCLLFAYKFGPEDDQTFIGAVMGQPNYYGMFATAKGLFDSAKPHFKTVEVLPAGTYVADAASQWGQSVQLTNATALKVYGWEGKRYDLETDITELSSPLLEGQVVGKLSAGEASVDLISKTALASPSAWWKIAHYWYDTK